MLNCELFLNRQISLDADLTTSVLILSPCPLGQLMTATFWHDAPGQRIPPLPTMPCCCWTAFLSHQRLDTLGSKFREEKTFSFAMRPIKFAPNAGLTTFGKFVVFLANEIVRDEPPGGVFHSLASVQCLLAASQAARNSTEVNSPGK